MNTQSCFLLFSQKDKFKLKGWHDFACKEFIMVMTSLIVFPIKSNHSVVTPLLMYESIVSDITSGVPTKFDFTIESSDPRSNSFSVERESDLMCSYIGDFINACFAFS